MVLQCSQASILLSILQVQRAMAIGTKQFTDPCHDTDFFFLAPQLLDLPPPHWKDLIISLSRYSDTYYILCKSSCYLLSKQVPELPGPGSEVTVRKAAPGAVGCTWIHAGQGVRHLGLEGGSSSISSTDCRMSTLPSSALLLFQSLPTAQRGSGSAFRSYACRGLLQLDAEQTLK